MIPEGAEGDWDQYSMHDPYPLVQEDLSLVISLILVRNQISANAGLGHCQ